ncbi:hypothetical protein F4861DRAFT_258223 [Xylaria intraflava]|nr:hypothetical protein F4861DRAFT_258223 [Xylaria intraflava]
MVKSLVNLCLAVCIRNTKDITDVGVMSYDLVRPIIQKIDSAAQLHQLEVKSPHLQEHTSDCWKRLVVRDFPVLCERYNFVPSNPKSWHKIYVKYQRIDTQQKREAEEKLINAFKEIKKEKDGNTSQVINYDSRKLPRLPRDVKPQVGSRPRAARVSHDQSELRFTGGSRTKTNQPKSLLTRARREAKEISTRNRLNTQTGAAQARPGQVMRAPAGMVHEKVTNARPLTGIRSPAKALPSRNRELEENEARLRRIKETGTPAGGSFIADEDLEDLDTAFDDGSNGLSVEDLEAQFSQAEVSRNARRPRGLSTGSGTSSAGGSRFARRMNSSSTALSPSKLHVEPQPKTTPQRPKRLPAKATGSSPQTPGQTNAPSRLPPVHTPAPSSSPGLAPPRKRKAVDVFMKPKPKSSRS